jgi:hypothetical protein
MKVSVQLHAPATLPPGKEQVSASLDVVEKMKVLPLLESEPQQPIP